MPYRRSSKSLCWILQLGLGLPLAAANAAGRDGFEPRCHQASGSVCRADMTARQLDYLTFATQSLDPGSIANAIAHMERDRIDPTYTAPTGAFGVDAWDGHFAKLANLEDTSDFNVLELINAYLGYGVGHRKHPAVAPELWSKVEAAILGFKFWYDQPTPEGIIDDMWYWSENHQIIFHTIEYLAGQTFPEETFSITGMTGLEHREHARPFILRWLDHRARFGFDEWHSNVYYPLDVKPLLTLVEFAKDREVETKAAMILDRLLFDLALHTFRGAFGATHGRSYKKDKNTALHENTFNLAKLLFDRTEYEYTSRGDSTAAMMARARKYRLPAVILDVARSEAPFADRERMGIYFDEFAPYWEDYPAPYGFSFEGEEDVVVWWSMGALTTWQVLPQVFSMADTYDLWETELFQPFLELRDALGTLEFAQLFAWSMAHAAALELMKEVNTYTYRTADYMLSSAQDYRKGSRGNQYHAWQATFDANAQVFTTHPAIPPRQTDDWGDDPDPGNWTGTASMPRSAQHENVAIHLYAPQYVPFPTEPFRTFMRYEPYTHAYFPQDHFDEVVRDGNWTFGRFRDGYIALYSWRMAEFVDHGSTVPTNGMTKAFDLIADGGPDNVWIVECGRAADWGGSFPAFQEAIRAARVTVTPVTEGLPGSAVPPFFEVEYESPSLGTVSFGWESPLVVAGERIPIRDYPRYDNPWTQTKFLNQDLLLHDAATGASLWQDFEKGKRLALRWKWPWKKPGGPPGHRRR
jgi:hypothetical protein